MFILDHFGYITEGVNSPEHGLIWNNNVKCECIHLDLARNQPISQSPIVIQYDIFNRYMGNLLNCRSKLIWDILILLIRLKY